MLNLALSYGFVFLVLGVSMALDKFKVLNDEGSRKFIHIGVSNWWILAMFLFDQETFYLAMIPPFTFIILNYISYRFDLIKAMERDEKSENDLGTVYYALSLFIITFFAFYFDLLAVGALAILIMGYGDGLSPIIGRWIKSPVLFGKKTLAGSLTVFSSAMVIGLILFTDAWVMIIFIAISASLIELFTPKGLDNLSLPLLVFILGVFIL